MAYHCLYFDSQNILDTEKFLLSQEIAIPVYFTHHSQQLEEMYTSIKESTGKDSASSAAQGTAPLLPLKEFFEGFFFLNFFVFSLIFFIQVNLYFVYCSSVWCYICQWISVGCQWKCSQTTHRCSNHQHSGN